MHPQDFHKAATLQAAIMAHVRGLAACCLLFASISAVSYAQDAQDTILFRVFLSDGRVLASYGEWARLDDRVVFSMPTRSGSGPVDLRLVTVPATQVDWPRTEQYAESVRAAAYGATRGETDFAQFSSDVARALNEVALVSDPRVRLQTAERARQVLADWPGAHYGYRSSEVRDILGMLDEVIAELRVGAGQTRFDLSLSAPRPAGPTTPLLPSPTDAEVVEQLMTAASLVDSPAERVSLLQTVLGLLDRAVGLLPAAWADGLRRTALADLTEEQRLDRVYATMRERVLDASSKAAARGDVKKLESLRNDLRTEDTTLTARRPGDIAALLSTIDVELESARRMRLARDQFELRAPAYRRYRRSMSGSFSALKNASRGLEQVRAMSGPPPKSINPLLKRLSGAGRSIARVNPPGDLAGVHALLRSACELAESAFRLRLDAASRNNIDGAQQASSAAAGALMLLARARADLDEAMRSPIDQ